MMISKNGVHLNVAPDADPAFVAKVAQFLANSVSGPVFVECRGGEVTVLPGQSNVAQDIDAAKKGEKGEKAAPDEPAAVEAVTDMPAAEDKKPAKGKK